MQNLHHHTPTKVFTSAHTHTPASEDFSMRGLSVSMVTEAGWYHAVCKFLCMCVCVPVVSWIPRSEATQKHTAGLASLWSHRSFHPEPNSDFKVFCFFFLNVFLSGLDEESHQQTKVGEATLLGKILPTTIQGHRKCPYMVHVTKVFLLWYNSDLVNESLRYWLQCCWLWNVDLRGTLTNWLWYSFIRICLAVCSPAACYL